MSAHAAGTDTSSIPRIIHQTWKDEYIPYEVYDRRWVESWAQHHPGWVSIFWTDERLRELGRTCYPDCDVMYGGDIPGIYLADFGRYMVLHCFGGLYVDLDYECLKNIQPLLNGHAFVTSYTGEAREELNNAIIASVPDHPLLLRMMQACCTRWVVARETGRLGIGPGPITGPTMMTEITKEFMADGGDGVTVHDSRLLCPIDWRTGASIHERTLSAEAIARVRDDYPDAYAATYWTHNH